MWDKIKYYGSEVYQFLTSRVFLINFGKMLGVMTISLFLLFKGLGCYTRHGEKATVENYIGISTQEAIAKAGQKGFDVVISDSVFLVGQRPDMVKSQNPAPNAEVKDGRTIYLTITKAKADLINLPILSGGNDDYAFYTKKLEMLGITARIARKETDPQLEDGTIKDIMVDGKSVLDQIAGGYKVPMGSTVDFVVSQREGDDTTAPDLTCKTADEASFLLQASHLGLGAITKDGTVTNQNTAFVVQQAPEAGTKLKKGQAINISLTQMKPKECPDVSEVH